MTSSNPIQSSTNLFRRLAWQSTVTLSIRLADDTPRGLSAGPSTERYYMQAPRYTYLPLLIPEIRENLVELALDEAQLGELDESGWWFEEDSSEDDKGGFAPQGACRWHWPLDLLELHSIIAHPLRTSSTPPKHPTLRLILHLSSPPVDKLLMPNSPEACQTQFLNALKEADFVRWRNTNKVTNMRRADLESGWEGIVKDDHDLYSRMASRLIPLPIPPTSSSSGLPSIRSPSTDPASTSSSSATKAESSYSARALPIKIYLPDGAPVIQEVITPLSSDGKPQTILGALRDHLPLLFPTTSTLSALSSSSGSSSSMTSYPLAIPLVQGVEVPPEAEVAWLSSTLSGADGWLRIGIQLRAE